MPDATLRVQGGQRGSATMVVIFKGSENRRELNFGVIDGWILIILRRTGRLLGGGRRVNIPAGLVVALLFLWKRRVAWSEGTFFTTRRDTTVGVRC